MNSIYLGNSSWPNAEKLSEKKGIVVVPIGAFEQHGYHLPLDTDQRLVSKVAEGSLQKAFEKGVPVTLLPTVWTGFSPHHMKFPGSITLSMNTFQQVIEDICISLSKHNFEKIFLLNGHGGNAALIKSVTQNLRFAHNIRTVNASYWDFVGDYLPEWRSSNKGGIDHACEMETSLMMYLSPEVVDKNNIEEANWFPKSKYMSGDLAIGGTVSTAFDFSEISDYGVAGDPSSSSAEAGEKLYEEVTSRISDFLVEFYEWSWNDIKNI